MGRRRALTIEQYDAIKRRLDDGATQAELARESGLSSATLNKINSGAWLRGFNKERAENERKAGLPKLPKLRSKDKETWCDPCRKYVRKPCVACLAKAYAAARPRRHRSDGTLHCEQQERPDGSVAVELVEDEDPLKFQLSAEQKDRLVGIHCRLAFNLPTLEEGT